MRKNLFIQLLLAALFVAGLQALSIAQQVEHPTQVRKAAFFDQTPRLIDMPVRQPVAGDHSWKEGIVENETVNIDFHANDLVVTDAASTQEFMGTRQVRGPVVGTEGTANVNGVYPPDTDGDVGPNHYFQMINLSFAIYDKGGNKLYGPAANSTLWANFPGPWSGTNDGDPIVLYDEAADRWVASQFAINTSNNKFYELVAVSQTGDPLGSWYRYAFEFNQFPDYPKLSVWHDGYYATFHMFSGGFIGSAFVAFEREKMLQGDPDAQMIYFGPYSTRFGYLPADIDGAEPDPSTPCYFAGINFSGNQNMEIWEMVPDWNNTSNSTFSLAKVLDTDPFNSNIGGITQPGTGTQLDDFSNVLMYRLPFRNFGSYHAMAANHAVRVGTRSGIRWYELRNDGSGWEIYQQGTYAPDNHNRWLGSIAIAGNGNIALGYSVSSSSVYPSIRYTGRTPNAPLGEMNITEVEVKAGGSSQSGINRWGDYAAMTVDPVNDTVFWFTTEYMRSNGWGTYISSFDFGPLQEPTVYAGNDSLICENTLFPTNAVVTAQNSVQWTTSGDGVFQNSSMVNTNYLRGNGDLANGSVTLTLTAYGFQPGWEASDEVVVSFAFNPNVNAGPDQTIVAGNTATLEGTATDYSSVEWSTSGDGTFADPASLTTTYTPGPEDIAAGLVNLTLTATAVAPCEDEEHDDMKVFINTATGVSDIPEDVALAVVPNPGTGLFHLVHNFTSPVTLSYKVLRIDGKTIQSDDVELSGSDAGAIDLSSLPKGVYFIRFQVDQGFYTQKLIIR
ncbi:MAG: hypothetical protein Kow00127_18840 [Bacteroidales bacterium]